MKILNAFSLQMLATVPSSVTVAPMSIEDVKAIETLESAVGHADTAAVLSNMLGREIAFNRANVQLGAGDVAVVAQYKGPRLAEGTTVLPEGAQIVFLKLTVS